MKILHNLADESTRLMALTVNKIKELPVDSAVSGCKVAERCLTEWLERDSKTKSNRERKWVWVGKV